MEPGQQVDSFTIIRLIGRGGMAEVYEARQEELNRRVALKILFPTYAEQGEITLRFQREGQATARLNHPNIVQVYATGTTPDGLPYLAMEFCPQGSLSDWLEKLANHGQLLQSGHALAIGRQIADALRVAHSNQIVHRDLKTSNILIRQDGSVLLADLGIAAVRSATRITSTGTILGTPQYMSPEQASGGSIDGRSDIYSLGIVFYEMLGGRRPFDAEESLAILHQQIYKDPIPLQRLRPELPGQVYRTVRTCLQKKPEMRYQNAAQLVASLDDILRSMGVDSRIFHPGIWAVPGDNAYISRQRLTRTPTKSAFWRGRPWYLFVAIFVIIALLFVGGLFITSESPDSPPSNITRFQEAGAGPGQTRTITPRPVASVASGEEFAPIITIITPTPSETPEEPTPTDTEEPTLMVYQHLPGLNDPADSLIAFVSDRDGLDSLYVMPPRDQKKARRLTASSGYDWWPAWCGRDLIAFERGNDSWDADSFEIATINVDGSDLRILTSSSMPRGSDMNGSPSCSPDGDYLAISSRTEGSPSNDFKVGIVDLRNSSNSFDLIGDGYSLGGHVGWSPDSASIVFMHYISSDRRFSIYRVDLNDPFRPLNLSNGFDGSCKYPSWSPDGQYVSFTCSRRVNDELVWDLLITAPNQADNNILLQELHTGAERYDDRKVVRHAITPSWSPDSQWIIFSSDRDGDWDIYALSIQNSDLVNLTDEWPSDEFHPNWGPG